VAVTVAGSALLFAYGSVVKSASINGASSIADNLTAARNASAEDLVGSTRGHLDEDWQYRAAGLELSAGLLMCVENGAQPLYGDGLLDAFISGLPNFIRPAGSYGERAAISRYYLLRGLEYDDSTGTPLASGISDWGVVGGPLIYGAMGLFYVALWRFVRQSPKLLLAYLLSGYIVQDMFWENAFLAIRVIGFAWMLVVVLSPILVPKWSPSRAQPPIAGNSRRLELAEAIQ
jgi:hypothetical protein